MLHRANLLPHCETNLRQSDAYHALTATESCFIAAAGGIRRSPWTTSPQNVLVRRGHTPRAIGHVSLPIHLNIDGFSKFCPCFLLWGRLCCGEAPE